MNQISKNLIGEFKPTLALVVYEGLRSKYYIESHPISESGQLLEGRPLLDETIRGMVEIFREDQARQTRIGGDIPACLLHYTLRPDGGYSLWWHRPAEQRTLWFKEGLHIPSGPAMVPPMLYVATGNSLSVWALKTDTRPDEKTERFRAPFHNVNNSGSVCLGSAKVKAPAEKTFQNMIDYWEAMFWQSEFSHLNTSQAVREGENVNLIWSEQVQNPERLFPLDVLLPVSQLKKSRVESDLEL